MPLLDRLAARMGHRTRQQRRHRCQRRRTAVRRRRVSARCRASYPPHAITDRFELMTAFPLARSMAAAEKPADGRTPQPFVADQPAQLGGNRSRHARGRQGVEMNADKGDKQGPVSIAVAVSARGTRRNGRGRSTDEAAETRNPRGRGSATLISRPTRPSAFEGNGDLFMNTVNWLAQQENLIAIRPKEAADRRVTMTADQMTVLTWMSLVIIPALVSAPGCSRGGGDVNDAGVAIHPCPHRRAGRPRRLHLLPEQSRRRPEDAKEKAFASVNAEDIEEIQIKSASGQTSRAAEGGRHMEDRRAAESADADQPSSRRSPAASPRWSCSASSTRTPRT